MSLPSADLLLFIAVLPGPLIQKEVTAFKEIAAARFHSRHALKSPPHITLIPPFRMARHRLPELESTLAGYARCKSSFDLILRNFDCFRPGVIFIDVVPGEALKAFQSGLKEVLSGFSEILQEDTRPFHPHMTIAFKDLGPAAFQEAWAYFSSQQYERRFEVIQLTLLQHLSGKWTVETEFPLNPSGQFAEGKDT